MTDNTQPDSGRIITSSDILLHDAETALLYEELRAAIDDGHESMTHADALAEIAAVRAENVELRAQLEAIGAGGVSGPLMGIAAPPTAQAEGWRPPELEWDEVFDCAVAAWCGSSTSQEMLRMCFQSRTRRNEVSVGWTANELMAFATGIARLVASPPPPAEQQAAPKAAPGVGNSGFDHQTAADFLSGKPVSDEAVRKFVAASRWAHDERAALSATLLAMHGVLTSREAEIALLKKALLEAEAAPKAAPGDPVNGWPVEATIYKRRDEWVLELSGAINDCAFTCRHTQPGYLQPEDVAGLPSLYSEGTAPQQEAQEPAAYVHVPHYTVEGKVRPVVSFEKYQQDYADGIYSTRIPLYTAPQPAPAPLSEMPYEKRKAIQEGEQIGASDAWFKARHEMLDTLDRRNVFRAGFDRGWNAALAAQGDTP